MYFECALRTHTRPTHSTSREDGRLLKEFDFVSSLFSFSFYFSSIKSRNSQSQIELDIRYLFVRLPHRLMADENRFGEMNCDLVFDRTCSRIDMANIGESNFLIKKYRNKLTYRNHSPFCLPLSCLVPFSDAFA